MSTGTRLNISYSFQRVVVKMILLNNGERSQIWSWTQQRSIGSHTIFKTHWFKTHWFQMAVAVLQYISCNFQDFFATLKHNLCVQSIPQPHPPLFPVSPPREALMKCGSLTSVWTTGLFDFSHSNWDNQRVVRIAQRQFPERSQL